MNSIIKEYLLENKKILINGLGFFDIVYKSAKIHPILHTFDPPGNYVEFTKSEKETSDEFVKYVAGKEKITEIQAEEKINSWVTDLKETMKNEKFYTLGTLGEFSLDAIGNMVFIPTLDTDISPESYGLEQFTFAPTTLTKNEESSDTIPTPTQTYRVNKRKSRTYVFLSVVLVLLLTGIMSMGIFAVFFPQAFISKKENLFMQLSQWVEPVEKEVIADEAIVLPEEDDLFAEKTTSVISDNVYTEQISDMETEVEEENLIIAPVAVAGNVYIVLGSFQGEENARSFLEKVKNEHSNVVELGKGKSSGLWSIGIGPYDLPDAQQLIKEKKIKGWILKK